MRKLITFLLVASVAAGVQSRGEGAPPNIGASESSVRAALARHDLQGASVAFNQLVEAKLPPKQTNRPDPALDRLLVEQMVARGLQPPRPILQRLVNDVSASDYVHNLLLLATAEESNGEESDARGHYIIAANAASATLDQRLSGQLGSARLALGTDASAAVTALRNLDAARIPAERRWEVDLLLARALSIAEPANRSAQDEQLARAWAEAPDAGIGDHAVARVASDRAIAAARAGDRAKLVTLLAVDRSNRSSNNGQIALVSDLPICGENGITRGDAAVVEMQRIAPSERPGIALVWASRSGIGQTFVDAARRSGQFVVFDGAVALLTLRCRAAPATDYAVSVRFEDAIADWMTSRGAYPLANHDDAQNVTQLAANLASRTTRYGANSIMRLPVLLQLMACVFPQVEADEQARARINDLVAQITAVLEANDAPQDVKLLWRIGSMGTSIATRAKTPAQAQAELKTALVAAADNRAISRDFLYMMAIGLGGQPTTPSDFKDAVLTATLKLFEHESAADPRARALALKLYILRAGNGDMAGARAALTGRSLADDLCVLATPLPHYISSDIRSDDYPSDIVYTGMIGLTPSEFDLDATGQAVNGRVLVSDPPYVFDDITRHGITTFRYDPPLRNGKPQACRGMTQSVRWQLPY
jgi:uncharacterized protein YejL (UPF0352 family)